MADRLPLVLDDNAQVEQLQDGDVLVIPLEDQVIELQNKVDTLETQLALLVNALVDEGFDLPDDLTDEL